MHTRFCSGSALNFGPLGVHYINVGGVHDVISSPFLSFSPPFWFVISCRFFKKARLRQWLAFGQGGECGCRPRRCAQLPKVEHIPSLLRLASFVDVRGTGVMYADSAKRYLCVLTHATGANQLTAPS